MEPTRFRSQITPPLRSSHSSDPAAKGRWRPLRCTDKLLLITGVALIALAFSFIAKHFLPSQENQIHFLPHTPPVVSENRLAPVSPCQSLLQSPPIVPIISSIAGQLIAQRQIFPSVPLTVSFPFFKRLTNTSILSSKTADCERGISPSLLPSPTQKINTTECFYVNATFGKCIERAVQKEILGPQSVELQLASFQTEEGTFLTRLQNLQPQSLVYEGATIHERDLQGGDKRLVDKAYPMLNKGFPKASGFYWTYFDSALQTDLPWRWPLLLKLQRNPIGYFRLGLNLPDLIARRLASQDDSLVHVPQAVITYFSTSSRMFDPLSLGTTCKFGEVVEFIPPINSPSFSYVSITSLQATASLGLILDNRDFHSGNIIIRDFGLTSIDHDHSLNPNLLFYFPDFIRKGSLLSDFILQPGMHHSIRQIPSIAKLPFWFDQKIIDRMHKPIHAKVHQWLNTLDLRAAVGGLNPADLPDLPKDFTAPSAPAPNNPIVDPLPVMQTRLFVLKAAATEQVPFLDLYWYMTPHFPLHADMPKEMSNDTILHDYEFAIQMTHLSFVKAVDLSDAALNATFFSYFEEVVALRMKVLAKRLSLVTFKEIVDHSIQQIRLHQCQLLETFHAKERSHPPQKRFYSLIRSAKKRLSRVTSLPS